MAFSLAGTDHAAAQARRIPSAPPYVFEAGAPPFAVLGAERLGLRSPPTDLHLLPDGRILAFANPQIAIGDGIRWETYSQAPGDPITPASGIAVDDDGRVYVGIPGGFGRIDLGEDGYWRIHAVAPWPGGEHVQRPVPRWVIAAGKEWYWHSGSGSLVSWRPGQAARIAGHADSLEDVFEFEGAHFVSDRPNSQLSRLGPTERMTPVLHSGGFMAGPTITCTIPFGPGLALVGTYGQGLQLFDGTAVHPFKTSSPLAGNFHINDLCATEGGLFAAAVEDRGLVFFNRDGRPVQTLDRGLDHRLARVRQLLPAAGGVVWGLAEEGLVRVEFPSRISNMEALIGTGFVTVHPNRFDGKLWLLADDKTYRGEYSAEGRLVDMVVDTPADREVFNLSFTLGIPVAGTNQGAFYRAASGWVQFTPNDIANLRVLRFDSGAGRWLYGARDELGWLRRTPDGIEVERIHAPGLGNIFTAIVDRTGDVWLELGTGRLGRVQVTQGRAELTLLGRKNGVPDGWAQVYEIDGVAGFNVADQILRFDPATQRFTPDEHFPQRFPGLRDVIGRPGRDGLGRVWITANGGIQVLDETGGVARNLHEKMPPGFTPHHLTFEDNGVVWLHAERRLARYDPHMPLSTPVPVRALITHVTLATSNRSLFAVDRDLPPLAFADNSLIAHFVAPGNPFAAPVTFEVKLDGAGSGWTSTGGAGSAVFNRLKEGRYVLHVRPVSAGVPGAEATLAFSIRPPWFRTTLAYVAYVLTAAGVILAAAWFFSFLERRENLRLERLVAQRTAELHASNDRLASQVEEIRTLSQAIEQSPVAVFITRPDGVIVFSNPRSCELSGYSAAELIGREIRLLRAEPVPADVLGAIAATVARGETWRGQFVNRHQAGHLFHVRTMVAPIRSPDGTVRHHVILEEDITESLAAEARRHALEAQLFQAQKLESIGTLAGGIAHDFNNILTGILGYCELARLDAGNNPDVQRDLTEVRTAGLRAKDLVTQILTFSRQSHAELLPLDLSEVVLEALKLVRASTPATIEIISSVESGLVRADATQIQQVVLNLCTNALHAIRDGRGRIEVSVRHIIVTDSLTAEVPDLPVGPRLRLAVADNGAGMDRATLDRIFDPFFTTKRPGEGTGLGLAIVQGIAASHGAVLRVLSAPGTGTTFEIYFVPTADPPRDPASVRPVPRGHQEEILVVDDEPAVAAFVAKRLQQLGYVVTVFAESRAALDAISTAPTRFQAIVTDLTMPDLTGADLVQAARSRGWMLPAVIITGYGSDGLREQLAALSRCVVLPKPFSGDDLARILDQVLRNGSASLPPA